MRVTKRAVLTGFVLLLAVLLAAPAQARRKKAKKRSGRSARTTVVLVGCSDKAHRKVRSAVEGVLKKKKFKVVKVEEDDSGLAAKHKAVAVLLCSASGKGKEWTASVEVKNGASGSSLVKSTFEAAKARKLGRAVKKTLWKEIGTAMGQASARAATAAEAADKPDEPDEPDEPARSPAELDNDEPPATDFDDDEGTGADDFRSLDNDDPGESRSPPPEEEEEVSAETTATAVVLAAGAAAPLEVHAGMRVFSRSLGYDTATVPSYSLGTGTAVEAGAAWYPMAHLTNNTGILGRVGVTFQIASAFGLDTSTASSATDFPTVSNTFLVGVRGYHAISKHRVQLDLGFGGQSFIIKSAGSVMRPNFPNVKYRFGRLAASGNFAIIDKLSAAAYFGYRMVFQSGQFESTDFFPNSSASGLDFGVSADYTLIKNLQARAGVDFVRYGFSLNTTAGDPFVADSASDMYISFTVNAVYTFDN